MSERRIRLGEDALRDALTEVPRAGLAGEVAARIESSIATTPQDRPRLRLGSRGLLWTDGQGWARPLRLLVVAAIVLATVGVLLVVGSRLPRPLPGNGVVVLGSDRAGLLVADPGTGEARQLVAPWPANPAGRTDRDDLIAIAPAGDRLAYIVAPVGPWSIPIVSLPSGERLSDVRDDGREVWPEWGMRWSHDGGRLYLEATVAGLARIVAADPSSGGLADVGSAAAVSRDAAPSPVDGRVAFVQTSSTFDDDYGLVVWDPATSATTRLVEATVDGSTAAAPAWAPDGRTLAVTVTRPDGMSAVARIGADGTGYAVITPWTRRWPYASWSPEGSDLLVALVPQGGRSADIYTNDQQRAELFLMEPDGHRWRPLVALACSTVAWSPDGRSIAYVRGTCDDSGAPAEVRVIAADGTGDRAVWRGDARGTGRLSIAWQAVP